MDRRRFIQATAFAAAGSQLVSDYAPGSTRQAPAPKTTRPAVIATWRFGKPACELALKTAKSGSMLDGIEQGIRLVEEDESNSSVGIGGIPNADGVVELDACIMAGPGHRAGSVGGLQDILHPISVARRVMEETPHVMLVGQGAKAFALSHGFQAVQLLTDNQRTQWQAWQAKQNNRPADDKENHDTIAMIGVDSNGDVYGGCSTSGLAYKLAGRVGDSPILGSGLYVDNSVGGAGATGVGENVMRYCGTFLIVEFMRSGMSPAEACEKTIRRIAELDPKNIDQLSINFIAINKQGEFGAAGTSPGFQFAFATNDKSDVVDAKLLTAGSAAPEGDNQSPK